MAIPLDFSRSNQTLARFNQFLTYDLLDQKKSERDVALMGIQDRLMRERQVEAGQIDIGVAEYKSALSNEEAWTKAKLEFAKQPRFEYLNSWANMATDTTVPEKYHSTIRNAVKARAEILGPVADAFQKASVGKMSWENAYATLDAAGIGGITDVMQETGSNRRANLAAGIEEQKIGVEREKLAAAERGVSTKATDEKAKQYVDWIDKTVAFISAEGVKGNALVNAAMFLTGGKTRDPYAPELYGKVLSDLQGLKRKILNGEPLTRGNEDYIIKVWNARSLDASGETAAGLGKVDGAAPVAGVTAGGGGLPSPETGTQPSEFERALEAVRQTWISQKIAEFYDITGISPSAPGAKEEAMRWATEHVDTNIMPGLRKSMR